MSGSGPCACALAATHPHRANRCFLRVAKKVVEAGQAIHQELNRPASREESSSRLTSSLAAPIVRPVQAEPVIVAAEAHIEPASDDSKEVTPPTAEATVALDDIDGALTPALVVATPVVDDNDRSRGMVDVPANLAGDTVATSVASPSVSMAPEATTQGPIVTEQSPLITPADATSSSPQTISPPVSISSLVPSATIVDASDSTANEESVTSVAAVSSESSEAVATSSSSDISSSSSDSSIDKRGLYGVSYPESEAGLHAAPFSSDYSTATASSGSAYVDEEAAVAAATTASDTATAEGREGEVSSGGSASLPPVSQVREVVRSKVVDVLFRQGNDPGKPCTCYFSKFAPHRVQACTFRGVVKASIEVADTMLTSAAEAHMQMAKKRENQEDEDEEGAGAVSSAPVVVVDIDPEVAARETEILRRFLVVEAAVVVALILCAICIIPFYVYTRVKYLGLGECTFEVYILYFSLLLIFDFICKYADGVIDALFRTVGSLGVQVKTAAALLTIYLVHHRLLAFIVCHLVRRLAGGSWSSPDAFNMDCDWISLRLGLDHNELIVSGFVWKNPAVYTKYRTFIDAKTIRISCSTSALMCWLIYREPLILDEVYADGCNVFLIRKKDTGVFNYDAAVGSKKRTKIDRELRGLVMNHVNEAMEAKAGKLKKRKEMVLGLNKLVLIGPSLSICGSHLRENIGLPRNRRFFYCDSLVLTDRDWTSVGKQSQDDKSNNNSDKKKHNAGLGSATNTSFYASYLGKKIILAVISKYAEQYSDSVVSVVSSVSMQKLTKFFRG